jgi:hypothetical protein
MARNNQRIVLGCLILVAAGVFFATGLVPKSREWSLRDQGSKNLITPSPQVYGQMIRDEPSEAARESTIQASGAADKVPISREERKLIHEWTEKMESSLKAVELANTTTAYDKTFPETTYEDKTFPPSRRFMLRVSPPSTEEVDDAYIKVSEAIKAVGSNPAAQEQMTAALHKVIATYFTFPMKVKFLQVTLNGDQDRVIEFSEYYVDDESLIFRPDGTIRLPGVPYTVSHHDGKFGSADSWASKRYAHMIQVETEKETK